MSAARSSRSPRRWTLAEAKTVAAASPDGALAAALAALGVEGTCAEKKAKRKRRGVEELDPVTMTEEQRVALLIECCLVDYSDYGNDRLKAFAEVLEVELEPIAEAARTEAKEEAVRKGKVPTTICHGATCTRKVAAADKYCTEHMPAATKKAAKKPATKKAAKKKGKK